MSEVARVAIDLWADVICPWCAIGHARLARAREMLAGEIEVEVRFRPFELDPDTPAGGVDSAARLAEKYGRTAEEVAAMQANVEAAAEASGTSFAWTGKGEAAPRRAYNTFRAHVLLAHALESAGPAAQERVMDALFAANFRQRADLEDEAVLIDCAAAGGLAADGVRLALADPRLAEAVRAGEAQAARMDIRGVPAQLIDGRYLISGAREAEVYVQALREVVAKRA